MGIEKRKNFLINTAYIAIILGLIFIAFKFLSMYLMPFLIGIAASFLVQRPARSLSKKTKIPKSVLTIFFVILTYAIICLLIFAISYFAYVQIFNFATNVFPTYIPTIQSALEGLNLKISELLNGLPADILNALNNFPQQIFDVITKGGGTLLTNFGMSVVKAAPRLLVTIIVTLVASCFIAKDYDKIIRFAKLQLSKKTWDIMVDIKELFTKNILRILRGYLILMFITFLELCIFIGILGRPNFIFLAALISVVDILPVLGTGTIVIPWALISLLSGDIFSTVVLVIAYIVITVLRNFLEPRIIGQQLGLNPLVMLIALFVGLKVLGFAGMILFPLSIIIITELQKKGKIHLWKTEEDNPPSET